MHANTATTGAKMSEVLQEAVGAYDRIVTAMQWPSPLSDGATGGNKALDLYLVPHLADEVVVAADAPRVDAFYDSASAFVRLDPLLPSACYRSFRIAQAVARAGIYAVDAGAHDAFANAVATFVANEVRPCSVATLASIDDDQRNPERALTQPGARLATSSHLFPSYLHAKYGSPPALDMLHALFVVSGTKTQAGRERYVDEPDAFDVLRQLAKDRQSSLSELLLDYSISRAFLGTRDDGQRSYDSASLGAFGRIRFDWAVPFSSLPRILAPRGPIEPTGAFYYWIDMKDHPKDAGLAMRAQWEDSAIFRFAIVQIGADGAEVARSIPTTLERSTSVDVNVEHMEQAVGALIVGVNVGSLSKEFEFDPDEIPYVPSSCMVSLTAIH